MYDMSAMKNTFLVTMMGLSGLLSCQPEKDPVPGMRAELTETWWCDSQRLLPDQYFGVDGAYKQRQNGDIQSGQWRISEDKKSILITDFGPKGEGAWSYGLKDLQSDRIVFTFYGGANSFAKCQ